MRQHYCTISATKSNTLYIHHACRRRTDCLRPQKERHINPFTAWSHVLLPPQEYISLHKRCHGYFPDIEGDGLYASSYHQVTPPHLSITSEVLCMALASRLHFRAKGQVQCPHWQCAMLSHETEHPTHCAESVVPACRLLMMASQGIFTTVRDCLFLDHTSEVMLISLDPDILHSGWRFFMDSITSVHKSWAEVDSTGFSTLIIRGSEFLNFEFATCAPSAPGPPSWSLLQPIHAYYGFHYQTFFWSYRTARACC